MGIKAEIAFQLILALVGITTIYGSNVSLLCQETQFPQQCLRFLSSQPKEATSSLNPIDLAAAMVSSLLNETRTSLDLSTWVLISGDSDDNSAMSSCAEMLEYSSYRISMCQLMDFYNSSSIEDAQHFISAALTYHTDCIDAISQVSAPSATTKSLAKKLKEEAVPLLSNTLYLLRKALNASYKAEVNIAKGLSMEYLEKPTWITEHDHYLCNAPLKDLKPSMVVSKKNQKIEDSEWTNPYMQYVTFETIQDAVNNAPSHSTDRYLIYITEGIYEEQVMVPHNKSMLMFVGDGENRTILRYNNSVNSLVSTYLSSTLGINGDQFLARDLTVENTAPADGGQAVALRANGDKSAFYRCSFKGHQDTLYAHTLRQFYRSCYIEGTIDFIFGNSASIFQQCDIRVVPGKYNSGLSTLTAQGRSDPSQATGMVFQGCNVGAKSEFLIQFESNPTGHKVFLGRPWKFYARVVFLDTYLSEIVDKSGWMSWSIDQNNNNVFLAEYNSYGPGASVLSGRVPWSRQLNHTQVSPFSVPNFIEGNEWLPSTGVPCQPC